ncbi:MAG: hypothetical protein MUE46_01145 [Xanthomonadales bacterium]|jgi:hypothetical protein|nr:hypothetical protein [Xanthomonadales bacterium]
MSSAPAAGLARFWRWLSWPLLLLPLGLAWYFGLAGLAERVDARRVVDRAAFESGFSPLRFDFTTDRQLIGREVQGGRFVPAVAGTTVVEPAKIEFDAAGVFFGLRFEGRVLDLGVFRELVLVADASCPASLRLLLDGEHEHAAWISAPVALPAATEVGWGRGLPASLVRLDELAWSPRAQPGGATRSLSELPPLQRALRLHVEATPTCVLRLDSLGFAAESALTLSERHIPAWTGPGPARHAVERGWATSPQELLVLEPVLPGAAMLRAVAAYAGFLAAGLAALALLTCFLRRRATSAALLVGSLLLLNLVTVAGLPVNAALLLAGLAALLLGWDSWVASEARRPDWRIAAGLGVTLLISMVLGESAGADLRYLGFALLQQSLLLLVLWPALAALDDGTRIRLLAAGFALMHLPNFELSLLCLVGGLLGLSWYARRGDALSVVLAHALIGLWLGRSDGFGWLWGLETGWRWFG